MKLGDLFGMLYKIAPFLGLIVGIVLASLLEALSEGSSTAINYLQQIIVIACLATTIVLLRPNSTWIEDLSATFRAFGLVVAIQITTFFVVLLLIDYPPMQLFGQALGEAFLSIGWYPPGADAWLPLALAIWVSTAGLVVLAAVGVSWVVRRILR